MRLTIAVLLAMTTLAAAEPHVRVKTVTTVACETDGGPEKCSSGVRYLGDLVQRWFDRELKDHPLACSAADKGEYSFHFGYEYNSGEVFVLEEEKRQAKWPACVQQFSKQVTVKLLEWWKMLQPIDDTIDVRSKYKVTIAVTK